MSNKSKVGRGQTATKKPNPNKATAENLGAPAPPPSVSAPETNMSPAQGNPELDENTPGGIGMTDHLTGGLVGGQSSGAGHVMDYSPEQIQKERDNAPAPVDTRADQRVEPARSMTSEHPAVAATVHAHHVDDPDNPGRLLPRRGEGRIPVGKQTNLSNVEEFIADGFKGHWFAKKRIDGALAGGYEFVKDNRGVNIERGKETKLTLMQIPQQYWDEDQADKVRRAVDALASSSTIDESRREYGDEFADGRSVRATGVGTDPLFD